MLKEKAEKKIKKKIRRKIRKDLRRKIKKKNPLLKAVKVILTAGTTAAGTLFTIYMLNLDQKLLAWSYARVNEIFDRKETDIKF